MSRNAAAHAFPRVAGLRYDRMATSALNLSGTFFKLAHPISLYLKGAGLAPITSSHFRC